MYRNIGKEPAKQGRQSEEIPALTTRNLQSGLYRSCLAFYKGHAGALSILLQNIRVLAPVQRTHSSFHAAMHKDHHRHKGKKLLVPTHKP
jgi:hypothetical protein